MTQVFLPQVVTSFASPGVHLNHDFYHATIVGTLESILPDHLFAHPAGGEKDVQEQSDQFHALLPYVTWTVCDTMPCIFSFFSISRYRSNAFRFFFEMITHWLVPGKRLNAISIFAADFSMPSLGSELYTLCELVIRVEDPEDLYHIHTNLTTIETELRLGLESSYYARRILEIKGVSADEKIAIIQEHIALLVKRLPAFFDYDLMAEMQHQLVMCRDEFRAVRQWRHLTRMICLFFLFRKKMKEQVKLFPAERHVNMKIFRSFIQAENRRRNVLGIIVGVNFLRDKEVFEKRHLLSAIRMHISDVRPVEGSYLHSRRGHEPFCLLYFEIEKGGGGKFSSEEISSLLRGLPLDLKDLIEHPIHPVFMPRNEEESMRSVLMLSSQIKYVRDIPQVVINFDEQTHSHLFFNVILVQVVKPGTKSLQEILSQAETSLEYIHERTKTLGFLRKKYPKEAVIFRVKLSKEMFLRRDHTIDLYKARQTVVVELSRLIGDIRDFNGGMIAKQNETLSGVRELMGDRKVYSEHLLENYFFSIMPPVIRTLIEPVAVKTLFDMFLELVGKNLQGDETYSYQIRAAPDFVFAAIRGGDASFHDEVSKRLTSLQFHPSEVASSSLRIHEVPYLGYIYRCDDEQKQSLFCQLIENTLSSWSCKKTD